MGKDIEELEAAEVGDGDDEVGGEAGVESALEAAEAIGLFAPVGMEEEVEVMEGPDEAGLGEAGGSKEGVEVEEVGVAEAVFEGFGVEAPEAAGPVEAGGSGAEAEGEGAGAGGIVAPLGIEEEIADDGVEDERVGRGEAVEGAKEFGGDDATAGFTEGGLADVEAECHAEAPEVAVVPAAWAKASA